MEGSHEITAVGVLWGMKACVRELTGNKSLKGVHVAVQGVGDVGRLLVDELAREEARITVTDIRYDALKIVQDRHPDVDDRAAGGDPGSGLLRSLALCRWADTERRDHTEAQVQGGRGRCLRSP